MIPGRNRIEGIVEKIKLKKRKIDFRTIPYYSITIKTPTEYIYLRLEGEHQGLVSRIQEQKVVQMDFLLQDDMKTVLKLSNVQTVDAEKAQPSRDRIENPQDTPKVIPTQKAVDAKLQSIVDQVTDPTARALLDKAVRLEGYDTYQAAVNHAYEGGLMERSIGSAQESLKILETIKNSDLRVPLTPAEQNRFSLNEGLIKRGEEISKSVIIAGALLHDADQLDRQSKDSLLLVDRLSRDITNPNEDVLGAIKNIIGTQDNVEHVRNSAEEFVVSMGISQSEENFIQNNFVNGIDQLAHEEGLSPDIMQTKADRLVKTKNVRRQMQEARVGAEDEKTLNSPTGGFVKPTTKQSAFERIENTRRPTPPKR